ncbi:MAG: helix-turn-helix domain-containing protein [Treponema sp.]
MMLNERIRALRITKGINQIQLANKLGVTKQSISNWENDNILPSVDMLVKLAAFFSVSTDYLLGLDNRRTLSVENLSDTQIAHLQLLIEDLQSVCK